MCLFFQPKLIRVFIYDYKGYKDGDARKNNVTPEAIAADKAFLRGIQDYVKKYDEAKANKTVPIDEVTKRPISDEAIQTARQAIILFKHDIRKKENKAADSEEE